MARRTTLPAAAFLACALGALPAALSRADTGPGAARLLKGPYLTGLSATGIDVRFELDSAGPATVEVVKEGASTPQPHTFDDRGSAGMHVVHVTGLEPATRYAYVVRAPGASVALGKGHLTTAPDPGAAAVAPPPLHFVVFGDNRSDASAHAAVVRALQDAPADFFVNTGDVVEDGGSAADWQTFFDVEAPVLRDRPLFLAIGNHELYDDAAGANFARYFGFPDASGGLQPYGTVRLGNARFFFLNGMDDFASGPERSWLEHALSSADTESGLSWRIAVVHHGPWSSGPHGANKGLLQARVPELLARHKVDLVLSGHDHLYERGDAGSMKYVISGGGGAPLYRVAQPIAVSRRAEPTYHFVEFTMTGDAVRLLAKRVDGSTLDTCGFHKGGPWDCDRPALAAAAPRAAAPAGQGGSTGSTAAETPAKSSCGCSTPGARVPRLAGIGAGALALFAAIGGRALARRRRRS